MTSKSSEDFFGKVLLTVGILAAFFDRSATLGIVAEDKGNIGDVNISALLTSFQAGYDKRVRPNYGGVPVTVGVTMYVLSFSSVSEVKMDFTVDMYFRQFWQDPRLSFTRRPGLEKLVVGAEYIQLIWTPDTFFVNEKTAYFHVATSENQFLRILHTGEILRSIRLTITASCPMNLQFFPMDRQLCDIQIESFGYTMSDVHYKWNDGVNSVLISPDVSLPQFKVLGHRQKSIEASLSTGNYSRLACEIQFVRSLGFYLIQIYLPSSLIVATSWISFWINRGSSPARVGLGVTTVLTMTTLMASTNSALPKVSYVKSIDVYLGFCFFMVFASLLEYASVGYMAKKIQMQKNRFSSLQKIAKQKEDEAIRANNAALSNGVPDQRGISKQTSTHLKAHNPMVHCKGGLQKNTVLPYDQAGSGRNNHGMPDQPPPRDRYYDEEAPPPPHRQGPTPAHHIGPPPPTLPQLPLFPTQRPLPPIPPNTELCVRDLNKMFGMRGSDIDRYSRIIFPVTFICFQLMYWIIYQHMSYDIVDDLVYLQHE